MKYYCPICGCLTGHIAGMIRHGAKLVCGKCVRKFQAIIDDAKDMPGFLDNLINGNKKGGIRL